MLGSLDINLVSIIILRSIILTLFGTFLLSKWLRAEKRFYSDFPFIMAITMFILVGAKIFDLFLYEYFSDLNFEKYTTEDPVLLWLPKTRWLLMTFNTLPLLYLMLIIWFNESTKTRSAIFASFTIFWTVYIITVPVFSFLKNSIMFLILPIAILSAFTYFWVFQHKRMPKVHGLIAGISWIAYILSTFIRPILSEIGDPPWGLYWVAEVIDLIIWSAMGLAFIIKPHYS